MSNEQFVGNLTFHHGDGVNRTWKVFCTFARGNSPEFIRLVWGCAEHQFLMGEQQTNPLFEAAERYIESQEIDFSVIEA